MEQEGAGMNEDDTMVALAMINYGGSFVNALGNAVRYADPDNLARLKAAFPHYWKQYRVIAQTNHKKGAQHE